MYPELPGTVCSQNSVLLREWFLSGLPSAPTELRAPNFSADTSLMFIDLLQRSDAKDG